MRDRRELEVTVEDPAALEAFEQAVEAFLEYRLDALPRAQAAVAADPRLALARCLLAALFLSMQSRRLRARAVEQLDQAERERARLEPRERLHLDAARAWAADDMERALGLWQAILAAWPRDILAVRLLQTAAFWCGDAELVRAAAAGVLPEWDEALPGFGHLQGMLAFGLEECGDYAAAEAVGRAAVERNPGDLWAVHAVAHVLEMQGRFAEGGRWLAHPPEQWDDRGPIKGHVWWHAALFALERDEPEADALLASLERLAAGGEGHAARVAGPLLLPIVRAVLAFWRGEPGRTVELLLPLRTSTAPLGGSHAQRDVIEQLLLEAALSSGRFDLARLLAAERVTLRPTSRPSWRKYAQALAGLGAEEAARAALARAAPA